MKKLFLFAALVLASVTGASAQLDIFAPVPEDPEVRKGVLENGMTYYIRHNSKPENQADFYIFHNVGAIQEEDTQQGLAHFTEHMAFNGTVNLPGKMLTNWAESNGIKFGANLNAATGTEMTYYMMSNVPLKNEGIIDTALLVLHDWSFFISMEPDEIDNERGVIVEELRTRNNAQWRVMDKARPYLFRDSKHAERNLIGYEEGLRSFPHQEIIDFYHRWYRTDLQAVIVVGDFDVDMMEQKVIAMMSDIPTVLNPEEKELYFIPENEEPIVGVITDPELTTSSVELYIKRDSVDPQFNNTIMVQLYDLIDRITDMIANERLSEMAQKPNAPFTQAGIYNTGIVDAHDAILGEAGAREGETLSAFEALYTEVERITRYGFTESELERAKENILRSEQQAYDRRDDRQNRSFPWIYINNYKHNTAMPSAEVRWELTQALLNVIDLQMLNEVIQKERFFRDNQVILVTAPEKEGMYVPTAAEVEAVIEKVRTAELEAPIDNTVREPLIPAGTKLKGSKVKSTATDKFDATVWTLKNGVQVVVKPTEHKADEIIVSAEAMGGKSVLPLELLASADTYGAYKSMAGLGKFSATELRKQLTGKSANVGTFLSNYNNGFYGSASAKDLETLMQLLYLNFTSPRYDESDFEVMMDRLGTQYLNIRSNPMFALQDSLSNTLFDHNPRRQMMTYEKLGEVKFENMKAIQERLFSRPADFVFTFVGDIDMNEFRPLVEKYLGSLPKSKKELRWHNDGVSFPEGVVENRFSVNMQMPKTTVVYIHTGQIPYTLKNSLMFDILSQVLDIRYTQSIREEKGGTYGVQIDGQVDFTPYENYMLLINFDTDPAMADELVEIVELEIHNIAENGVKADDLAKIKEYFAKKYPDDIRQNSYWNNAIGELHVSGHDFVSGYMDIVNSITGEDIQKLAQQIIADNNIIKLLMDPAL